MTTIYGATTLEEDLAINYGSLADTTYATQGASLAGYMHHSGGKGRTVANRLQESASLMDFLPGITLGFGLSAPQISANDTTIQNAIDYFNNLLVTAGGIQSGGGELEIPAGVIMTSGFTRKSGCNFKGKGRYKSVFVISQVGGTGIKGDALAYQDNTHNIYWLEDSGYSVIPDSTLTYSAPTTLWDMTGFSNCEFDRLAFAFAPNITAIKCIPTVATGLGGPSQFQNQFTNFWAEQFGNGGVGLDLGSAVAGQGIITTWDFNGGTVQGNGSNTGIGMKLNGAIGCNVRLVFQNLTTQLSIGAAAGATQSYSNDISKSYFEGSFGGYHIYPNAHSTIISGYETGVTNIDDSDTTIYLNGSKVKFPVYNPLGFLINMLSSAQPPVVNGTSAPGWNLTNADGHTLQILNNMISSSANSVVDLYDIFHAVSIMKAGTASVQFAGNTLYLGGTQSTQITIGTGDPNGVVGGPPGIYINTVGGVGATIWGKRVAAGSVWINIL